MKFYKLFVIVFFLFGVFFYLLYYGYHQNKKPRFKNENVMNKKQDIQQGVTPNEYGIKPEFFGKTNNVKKIEVNKVIVLFTETNITLDMTMEELTDKLPPHCLDLPKFDDSKIKFKSVHAGYPIQSHEFWTGFSIFIENDTIKHFRYYTDSWDSDFSEVGVYNLNDAVQKIESLLEQLKNQLGPIDIRRVVRRGERHEIMYAWKRENDWVVFIPNSNFNEKMMYLYEVYIISTIEELDKQFPTDTRKVPPNFKIWLDEK